MIPARAGSKRIKNKNIRLLAGKPVLAYVVENLILSEMFDAVIVSTDSSEIESVALAAGASVSIRPSVLACDHTTTIDVIKYEIEKFEESQSTVISDVFCAYPTSVFLERDILAAMFEIFDTGSYSFVITAVEYSHPIERAFMIKNTGSIVHEMGQSGSRRTQDCKQFFHDAALGYIGDRHSWLTCTSVFASTAVAALPVNRWQECDIDTESDWRMLEAKFRLSLDLNDDNVYR